MSIARPVRCLFCAFTRPIATPVSRISPRRRFHALLPRQTEKKTPDDDAPLSEVKSFKDLRPSHFKPYTEEEKAQLAERYTPQQIKVIEAAEKAIDPKDLAEQFAIRRDPLSLDYVDDFAKIEPVVDHHVRPPSGDSKDLRMKNPDEILSEVAGFVEGLHPSLFEEAKGGTAAAEKFTEYLGNMSFAHGDNEKGTATLVPPLVKPGETIETIGEPIDPKRLEAMEEDKPESLTPELQTLVKATGYTPDQIKGLRVKSLVSHFVVNQTRLGKIRKMYILSVAGNGNGLLGIGEGKSEDGSSARVQSQYQAIRNMQPILRYENRTIFGDVKGKCGAVELQLMHRPPGMIPSCWPSDGWLATIEANC